MIPAGNVWFTIALCSNVSSKKVITGITFQPAGMAESCPGFVTATIVVGWSKYSLARVGLALTRSARVGAPMYQWQPICNWNPQAEPLFGGAGLVDGVDGVEVAGGLVTAVDEVGGAEVLGGF